MFSGEPIDMGWNSWFGWGFFHINIVAVYVYGWNIKPN